MFDLFKTEVEDNATRMENGLVEVERREAELAAVEERVAAAADALAAAGERPDDALRAAHAEADEAGEAAAQVLAQEWRSLMRAAHSVKGAARMVNIGAAVQVAHAMENCFVAGQDGRVFASRAFIDLMLRGKDILVAIARTPEADVTQWAAAGTERAQIVSAYVAECEAFLANPAPREATPPPVETPASAAPAAAAEPKPEPVPAPEAEVSAGCDAEPVPAEPISAEAAPVDPAHAPAPAPQRAPQGSAGRARPATHINAVPGDAAAKPATGEEAGRMLRVTAEHLDRLLGLSGQSLVNARRLHSLADDMRRLKRMQRQVIQLLDRARGEALDERTQHYLHEARMKAEESQEFLVGRLGDLDRYDREAVDLSHRLYRRAQACRMRPFVDGVQHFPRMVRDLAATLGKEARLEISGKATEVDRDILDQLEAPLTHMIRNSLDHGIEFPSERARSGKPAVGLLRLEARHAAGKLIVSFTDDGKGIDTEHIRAVVLQRGLANAATAERLTSQELLHFLFLPGFTLRDHVSEFSGRGVGLDVVQHMLRQLRGEVRVTSEPGQGARFDLKLPLALSVVRSLVVEIAEEPYALPLSRIRHTYRLEPDHVMFVEGRPCFTWEKRSVAILGSWELLGKDRPAYLKDVGTLQVVIFEYDDATYAIAVDKFVGDRELVVQPLHRQLGKIPHIQSAAVLDDGNPVLILDVEDMARSVARMLDSGRWSRLQQHSAAATPVRPGEHGKARPALPHTPALQAQQQLQQPAGPRRRRLLVVDDSLTVRELERKVLAGAGYEVETAVDGQEGFNLLRDKKFDMVLTDVDMPRMDGIELTTLIKNNARLSQLPVMIVSYKDSEADRNRGLQAGADYYLAKSHFEDAKLLEAVLNLIGPAVPEGASV